MAKQVSVFAENKAGQISKISKLLKDNNINIRAIKISSSGDFGVIKLLVDKPDLCYEKLKEAGISAYKRDILGILMNDTPGGLFEISSIFAKHNLSIEDSYGFVIKDKKNAVLVIETPDIENVKALLKNEKLNFCSDEVLYK